jgi:hypothetical protein
MPARLMTTGEVGAALSGGASGGDCVAPIPGHQCGELGDLVIGDPSQHISEPGLWINVAELGRLNQCQHDGGTLAATIRAGEQPRLAAEDNLAVILPISGRM